MHPGSASLKRCQRLHGETSPGGTSSQGRRSTWSLCRLHWGYGERIGGLLSHPSNNACIFTQFIVTLAGVYASPPRCRGMEFVSPPFIQYPKVHPHNLSSHTELQPFLPPIYVCSCASLSLALLTHREKMKREGLSFEDAVVMRSLLDLPGGLELHIGVGRREGRLGARLPRKGGLVAGWQSIEPIRVPDAVGLAASTSHALSTG